MVDQPELENGPLKSSSKTYFYYLRSAWFHSKITAAGHSFLPIVSCNSGTIGLFEKPYSTCSTLHSFIQGHENRPAIMADSLSFRPPFMDYPVVPSSPHPLIPHCSSSPASSMSLPQSYFASTSTRRKNHKSDTCRLPRHKRPRPASRLSTISSHCPSIPA